MPRMLDLFAGRLGIAKVFAARGWHVVAVDMVEPPEVPKGVEFIKLDVLKVVYQMRPIPHFNVAGAESNPFWQWCNFDFGWASSPCEEFTVFGMKNFHSNPPYPEMGIRLFDHTRRLYDRSGIPYVMENVRSAQKFVGQARHHAGSFYLWGNAVPPLLPKGLLKGFTRAGGGYRKHEGRSITGAEAATIPPELANCVAEYAERLLETRAENREAQIEQERTHEPGL